MQTKMCAHYLHALITAVWVPVVISIGSEDSFSEELFVKPLPNGLVYFQFQFTTKWEAEITNPEAFQHYRLFPKTLGELISVYNVQELHLSLAQGLWRYEKWGYPKDDSPPGAELWVWFQNRTQDVDKTWSELNNALSGLFCATLNFMDSKSTTSPKWSFRPAGLATEEYAKNSDYLRYSALPREVVCTENLTPWKKLLPCDSKVGLSSLFNTVKLYDANYHSLSLHIRPVCADEACTVHGIEMKQNLALVIDTSRMLSTLSNWSFRKLFTKGLTTQCPLADVSRVYVDLSQNKQDKLQSKKGPASKIKRTKPSKEKPSGQEDKLETTNRPKNTKSSENKQSDKERKDIEKAAQDLELSELSAFTSVASTSQLVPRTEPSSLISESLALLNEAPVMPVAVHPTCPTSDCRNCERLQARVEYLEHVVQKQDVRLDVLEQEMRWLCAPHHQQQVPQQTPQFHQAAHASAPFGNYPVPNPSNQQVAGYPQGNPETVYPQENAETFNGFTRVSESQFRLTPEADFTTSRLENGVNVNYAVYEVGRQTKNSAHFNLDLTYLTEPGYTSVSPPPLYAHRYITGYGLEKGGISCHLYNSLPEDLMIVYLETLPWYMRMYYNSLSIDSNGTMTIKPKHIHYIPGKDRERLYTLEMLIYLKAHSVTTVSFQFDRAFLKWTEYPPDANHGFYVNSAVISVELPSADKTNSENASTFLRFHTESLLLQLPTPDFSMPYNVICLACTVVAIAFGSLHNLTTRRFQIVDPRKKKGIKEKIKSVLQRIFRRKSTGEDESTCKTDLTENDQQSETLRSTDSGNTPDLTADIDEQSQKKVL